MQPAHLIPRQDLVQNWPLWTAAYAVKVIGGEVDDNRPDNYLQRCHCLQEMVRLYRIRCRDCGGFGHNDRHCVTRGKITALGQQSTLASAIVANARRAVEKDLSTGVANVVEINRISYLPNARKRDEKAKSKDLRVMGSACVAKKRVSFYTHR